MRGTCGVGMRSKELCAHMSGEPFMHAAQRPLGNDTQGQNKDNNNVHCHDALSSNVVYLSRWLTGKQVHTVIVSRKILL